MMIEIGIGTDPWVIVALISIVSVLILTGVAYWLFVTPVRAGAFEPRSLTTRRVDLLVTLLTVSGIFLVAGSIWDASLHSDRNLTAADQLIRIRLLAAHWLINAGFILPLLTAGVALVDTAAQAWQARFHDPRHWFRASPHLGLILLVSLLSLVVIGTATLFGHGLDGSTSNWSAPRLFLSLTGSAVLISSVGLLFQKKIALRRRFQRDFAVFFLLALMMNVLYIFGVLEWELPGPRPAAVESRPLWSYPMIAGTIVFFTILLAKRLTVQKWAGAWTIVLFYMIRLLVTIGLDLTGSIVPAFPLPFFLGVLLVDAVAWQRIPSNVSRAFAASILFTFGYALITLPVLQDRPDMIGFSAWDFVWTILTTLLVGLLLLPVTRAASRRLARHGT